MIRYMERTRSYYAALGYPAYEWATHDDVPFTPLHRPLNQSRLALITTAAPFRLDLGDQGPGAAYNAAAKFFQVYTTPALPPPDLRISHVGYDRKHTTAEDPASWLPAARLQEAVVAGTIGELAEEIIGVPTNRSQRVTSETDAPEVLAHCQRLKADVALLVPT